MIFFLFFFFNVFTYFFFLFILSKYFRNKYIYPFRLLEIWNYILNTIIFSILAIKYFNNQMIISIIILNTNLFYINFHLLNMINTSPRTKILISLYFSNNLSNYNETVLLKNRIKRLASNDQITLNKNTINFIKDKKIYLFINFIFKLIKKI